MPTLTLTQPASSGLPAIEQSFVEHPYALPLLPLAIYARISEEHGAQGDAVSRQVADGTAWAERNHPGRPVLIYAEADSTSASDPTVFRPEYARLCADAEDGKLGGVVAQSLSRLSRDGERQNLRQLIRALDFGGPVDWSINFYSGSDAAVHAGGDKTQSRIGEVFAGYYSAQISHNVRQAMVTHSANGRPPGGILYGYDRGRLPGAVNVPTLIVNEHQAAVVREIAAALLAGRALMSIVAELNERGEPTATGKGTWQAPSLRKMMVRPYLSGMRAAGGRKKINRDGKEVAVPATQLHHGNWPAILEPDTQARLRDVLNAPVIFQRSDGSTSTVPRSKFRRGRGRKWLLTSGLARCGVCGGPLRATGRGSDRPVYHCAGSKDHPHALSAQALYLETVVLGRVDAMVRDPAHLAAALALAGEDGSEREAAVTALELLRIQMTEAQALVRGRRAAGKTGASLALLLDEVDDLEREIATAERRLADLAAPSAVDVTELRERWIAAQSLPESPERFEQIWTLLRTVLSEVTVMPVGKGGGRTTARQPIAAMTERVRLRGKGGPA
jgi:site-specific DNA recombinase